MKWLKIPVRQIKVSSKITLHVEPTTHWNNIFRSWKEVLSFNFIRVISTLSLADSLRIRLVVNFKLTKLTIMSNVSSIWIPVKVLTTASDVRSVMNGVNKSPDVTWTSTLFQGWISCCGRFSPSDSLQTTSLTSIPTSSVKTRSQSPSKMVPPSLSKLLPPSCSWRHSCCWHSDVLCRILLFLGLFTNVPLLGSAGKFWSGTAIFFKRGFLVGIPEKRRKRRPLESNFYLSE